MKKSQYTVGIDEVGRGPLAGPVAVGAVVVEGALTKNMLEGLNDSKKLTHKKREEWFQKIQKWEADSTLGYAVTFVNPASIDKYGIAWAIKKAIAVNLSKLKLNGDTCSVMLDGGLKAPKSFTNQETIIKGDETVPVISLASIVAKVLRDRKMERLAKKYPEFGFERHKGYGTADHIKAIKKHGACEIHRQSFIKKLVISP